MGCDIHLYVEVRGKDGAWRIAMPTVDDLDPHERPCWCVGGRAKYPEDAMPGSENCRFCFGGGVSATKWYRGGRNYELFGVLAGVRGGPDEFTRVRGLPENLSREVASCHADDDHTPTWYLLSELLERFSRSPAEEARARLMGAADIFWEFRDALWRMQRRLGPPSDVRVVLWFDN